MDNQNQDPLGPAAGSNVQTPVAPAPAAPVVGPAPIQPDPVSTPVTNPIPPVADATGDQSVPVANEESGGELPQ
ncbi:hypothetical protein A2617_02875 [Candidatus Daviesbacteria bacterium RIFOXYD1_FULL_41_10]|uniref:Uncharacterized protein n=1 Tax=Candidatus Daviesbacteria bacterium RIFOXYD1_FULL_41_10 TaxID=1797801 RepID=A0A1F5N362_9BACT|nr:MAG: hypothetical protein A2617_02875 [Candidatus Daviesbacteria bacterium RIFOXYD1_FULL_41_10]